MREPSTWIKLDRNIVQWRWFTDANTFRVFIYLLLLANIEDKDFKEYTIHRGSIVTSMKKIAEDLDISYKSVRTALAHLEKTQEVAITKRPNFLEISILNYDRYQQSGNQTATEGQSNGNRRATTKEYKELKNIRNTPQTPLEEDEEFQRKRMMLLERRPDDTRGN